MFSFSFAIFFSLYPQGVLEVMADISCPPLCVFVFGGNSSEAFQESGRGRWCRRRRRRCHDAAQVRLSAKNCHPSPGRNPRALCSSPGWHLHPFVLGVLGPAVEQPRRWRCGCFTDFTPSPPSPSSPRMNSTRELKVGGRGGCKGRRSRGRREKRKGWRGR